MKRRNSIKKDDTEDSPELDAPSKVIKIEDGNELSEYERIRLENIRRNQEFLGTLGLNDVKPSNVAAEKAIKATKRGTAAPKKKEYELPVRRSSRVTIEKLKEEIDILKTYEAERDGSNNLALLEEKETLLTAMLSQKQSQTYELQMENIAKSVEVKGRLSRDNYSALNPVNKPEDADNDWAKPLIETFRNLNLSDIKKSIKKESNTSARSKNETDSNDYQDYSEYIKVAKKLSVTENDVAKVTESRITSVWLHPNPQKVICAAGIIKLFYIE
jgi:hypothetical protein